MRRYAPRHRTAEEQRAREEFVASVTPPDHDPTLDNEAVEDVGHLDGACDDVLELTARRAPEEFAARYHERRTSPRRAAQDRGRRHLPECDAPAPGGADRMTKPNANRLARGAKREAMTADEYRALIQALVDQARADQSTAERLAAEAPAAVRRGDRHAEGDGVMALFRGT